MRNSNPKGTIIIYITHAWWTIYLSHANGLVGNIKGLHGSVCIE